MPSLVQKHLNYSKYTSQLLPRGCPILKHLQGTLILLRLETGTDQYGQSKGQLQSLRLGFIPAYCWHFN